MESLASNFLAGCAICISPGAQSICSRIDIVYVHKSTKSAGFPADFYVVGGMKKTTAMTPA
jgi:hypothetical protein